MPRAGRTESARHGNAQHERVRLEYLRLRGLRRPAHAAEGWRTERERGWGVSWPAVKGYPSRWQFVQSPAGRLERRPYGEVDPL